MIKPLLGMLKHTAHLSLVGYLCLVMLTGCGTVRVELQEPASPVRFPSPVIEQIALTVVVPSDQFQADGASLNDRGKFQQGLASSLEQSLTTAGVANSVLTNPSRGSWTMSVTGKWNSKRSGSEYAWEIIKVTFAVILFFIPVFFMSESFTVRTEADVILTDPSGVERGRSSVRSKLDVDIAVRKASEELFDSMFTMSSDDLANRVVLELKRHPHWFEPAR